MKALVTAGTRGIGAAICERLRNAGHAVNTFSRSTGVDGARPEERRAFMEDIGHCDILVNNLGGGGRYGTDDEVWQKNVKAMVEFTQWALNGMLQRKWGRVITISSIHGREYGSRAVFMAAKAAQIAYMKGLARRPEYVRNGVTFNTVCPGNVLVEGKPAVDCEALPMGRMGKPEEVAALVAFLCSDEAAWINGSQIVIDGGEGHAL